MTFLVFWLVNVGESDQGNSFKKKPKNTPANHKPLKNQTKKTNKKNPLKICEADGSR